MTTDGLHLAIIPDGNRRWAKGKGLLPWKGHETAVKHFRSLTDYCRDDPRVSVLTIWCFSTENWKRDRTEVSRLMGMLEKHLARERSAFLEHRTRFVHSGRTDRIPATLAALIRDIEEETNNESAFTLHLAVDYGGKDEVIRAVSALGDMPSLSEQDVHSALDHPELPDIDLVIRTSGERRTSNFFLWQSAYSEWVFCEKHFPEFETTDIDIALCEFVRRQRRHGA